MIYGNATGGFGMPKMIEIVDENENTYIGTVTDSEVIFDATRADVRIGKTFASSDGVSQGENTITYRTLKEEHLVLPQENFSIPLSEHDFYNYTKFQAIITKYETSISDSNQAEKIAINDAIFNVSSAEKISDITKNDTTKSIDFNIINETDDIYLIHLFTYRQEF